MVESEERLMRYEHHYFSFLKEGWLICQYCNIQLQRLLEEREVSAKEKELKIFQYYCNLEDDNDGPSHFTPEDQEWILDYCKEDYLAASSKDYQQQRQKIKYEAPLEDENDNESKYYIKS